MSTPPPPAPGLEFRSLLWLVLVATALFGLILWPFFGAVCWAVFIALVFWPLHMRFVAGSKGRLGVASFATLLVLLLIVILPLGLVASAVGDEAATFAGKLKSGEIQLAPLFQHVMDALPAWAYSLLERNGAADLAALQQKLMAALTGNGQALTARAFSIGQGTLDLVVSFFVMLYILFFLLRDGDRLTRSITHSIPLRREHTRKLLTQFATVVRATVKGNVVVALVQGALGGLAFWVLGVPGALLWGAVMALFSLLPAVGTALVWGPVVLLLLASGAVGKAVGLLLWGTLVIGLVDNVLRPLLVGKDTHMPDWMVLIATLGGLAVFGLNGFVIGPVIAAVFLVSWQMLVEARAEHEPPDDAGAPPEA